VGWLTGAGRERSINAGRKTVATERGNKKGSTMDGQGGKKLHRRKAIIGKTKAHAGAKGGKAIGKKGRRPRPEGNDDARRNTPYNEREALQRRPHYAGTEVPLLKVTQPEGVSFLKKVVAKADMSLWG